MRLRAEAPGKQSKGKEKQASISHAPFPHVTDESPHPGIEELMLARARSMHYVENEVYLYPVTKQPSR